MVFFKNLHASLKYQRIPLPLLLRQDLPLFSFTQHLTSRVSYPSSPSLLKRISSLAAQEISRDASALESKPIDPENKTETLGTKTRSLYSLFAKPSVVARLRKPSAPKRRKENEGMLLSKSVRSLPLERKKTMKKKTMKKKTSMKEVLPEMALLVSRLHEEGYLRNANFLEEDQLEAHQVPSHHHFQSYFKNAAERFGEDHQEIAKWLSGCELKKVALFGCPSVERKAVFSAKRLRSFFNIQEDIACRACTLKSSCKFMNQKVAKEEKVILADVMRVLTFYALDNVPQHLSIPSDLNLSIGKLLKEVVSLSK